MDIDEPHPEEPPIFLFSTPEGHALCRKILETHLAYEPHGVQIEGICKILDNVDLLTIMATRMGKTGFLSMYMLVVLAIKKDLSLCRTAKFPDNLCMPVICPTKYLEHQMVSDHCLTQMTGIMENSC